MSLIKVAVFSLNEPVFNMRKNIDDAVDFAKMRNMNKNITTSMNKIDSSIATRNAFTKLKGKLISGIKK